MALKTEKYRKYYLKCSNTFFADCILQEFERINLLFQSDNVDIVDLLCGLENFCLTMLRRVIHSNHVALDVNLNIQSIYLPIDKVDFGFEFINFLLKCTLEKKISSEEAQNIQTRCFNFLKRSCYELLSRLPNNLSLLKKVKNLVPSVCTNKISHPTFQELPLELADPSKISLIENQWRGLINGILRPTAKHFGQMCMYVKILPPCIYIHRSCRICTAYLLFTFQQCLCRKSFLTCFNFKIKTPKSDWIRLTLITFESKHNGGKQRQLLH